MGQRQSAATNPSPKPFRHLGPIRKKQFPDIPKTDPTYDPNHYLKIVVCSDTHGVHNPSGVPRGDIFVFAGDMTNYKTWWGKSGLSPPDTLRSFGEDFLARLPHRLKIVVAGNHDYIDRVGEDETVKQYLAPYCTYLRDCECEVDISTVFPEKRYREDTQLFRIWGSPWTRYNMGYGGSPALLNHKWDLIPDNTHMLVTHTPPFGIMDLAHWRSSKYCQFCGVTHRGKAHLGNRDLRRRVEYLRENHCLRMHCFGHVHEFKGIVEDDQTGLVYINGSGRVRRFVPFLSSVPFTPDCRLSRVLVYNLKIF